jgi:predicted transposase YbfD/YdcC
MGCQREIVKKIVKKEADYVIAAKQNQPSLYEKIEQLFKQAIKTRGENLKMSSLSSKEMNRGREETRNYFAVLRHIAVNIIGQNKSRKLSVRKKRFLASLDEEYSRELLEAIL